MDTRLMHEMLAQRGAASHAVAGALAPKSTSSTFKSNATNAADSGSSPTDASSAITSDDFLTLLVSELKNQDPTQPTDPNAYITQLAQVNSLEQLIQINSGISTLDSSIPTSTTGSTSGSSASGSAHAASLQPASAGAFTSNLHKQVPGAVAQ